LQIVYLPSQKNQQFQSFTAPLLNLFDSHVSAPFFGPNVWSLLVHPVAGGGFPPSLPVIELKMTFKEGGAFDFHANFERIKERLQQAMEHARESGLVAGDGSRSTNHARALGTVDFSSVHLDELPAYDGPGGPNVSGNHQVPTHLDVSRDGAVDSPPDEAQKWQPSPSEHTAGARFEPPLEPPPGYEETQQRSVADELENRLRQAR
jgi:WW domain-binding protein 2